MMSSRPASTSSPPSSCEEKRSVNDACLPIHTVQSFYTFQGVFLNAGERAPHDVLAPRYYLLLPVRETLKVILRSTVRYCLPFHTSCLHVHTGRSFYTRTIVSLCAHNSLSMRLTGVPVRYEQYFFSIVMPDGNLLYICLK